MGSNYNSNSEYYQSNIEILNKVISEKNVEIKSLNKIIEKLRTEKDELQEELEKIIEKNK